MNVTLAIAGEEVRAADRRMALASPAATLLQSGALLCAVTLMGLGIAVLLGWSFGYAPLIYVLPGHVSMKPNTAIAFLLMGAALTLKRRRRLASRQILVWMVSSVACIATLTLLEYGLGRNFGIDQWLFADTLEKLYPGRMAVITAISFLLSGVALLLSDGGRRARRVAQSIALGVGMTAMAAIVGMAYGVEIFYGAPGHTAMALHTGIGFLVLAFGIVSLDRNSGLIRMLSSAEDGALLFRRGLAGMLLLPLLLGWIYLRPEVNFGHPRFGMALYAVTLMCAGTMTLWRSAVFLIAVQQQRQVAEQALRHREMLERNNRQLLRRASTDPLTGLKNRGAFDERLRRCFELARCNGRGLAMLMIDVDDFKQRNDTWGHAAGDHALVRLGEILADTVREPDIVARYGGEEFAVLVPGGNLVAARVVAERIRTAVAVERWEHAPVTLSIGSAMLIQAMADGDELMRAADAALYKAKRTGKDRVVCAEAIELAAD